jgi:hypothetical protein
LFKRVGLSDKAVQQHVEQHESKRKSRGRRGGRRRTAAKPPERPVGPVDQIAAETGAMQNIGERPADYFESSALILSGKKQVIDQADDTLGEPDHEKEVRQKRLAAGKAKQARREKADAAKKQGTGRTRPAPKPKPEAKPAAAEKPAPAAKSVEPPADEEKPKPARRRRAPRRRKPNGDDKPASRDVRPSESDDDSYVD